MPRATTCPDPNQYRRLAAGQLSDSEREALLGHLEGCEACATRLNALPEQDTLVGLVREGQAIREGDSREAVARLVKRLSRLRPGEAPAESDQPTLPPAELAPARSLTFSCPACGKTLKVKGEMAGKMGKCPHCKQLVVAAAKSATAPARARGAGVSAASARTTTHAPRRPENTMDQPPAPPEDQGLYDFLAPPQAADELGRLGPYRVLRVLGAGGMGVVFRAEDPQLARLVALKAMLPSLAASASSRQRFLREAKAAAAIKHDHIVTIYQVGEDRGAPFLAMEFLEGEPLDARLKRQGKLPVAEVLRVGREIALGLAAAHKRQLIHRDIKPANVWLEAESGRVKILDFGLARAVGDDAQLTQSGAIMGTPAYMAPEQARGEKVDHRCELFSLGCVLYRLATGEAPFRGTDAISTLMSVAIDTPRPPNELEPRLPPALSELILCLLAKAPGDRPPSAQAVADCLEGMAADGAASRAAPSKRPAPPCLPDLKTAFLSRKKWPILADAAAGLLLVGLVVFWAAGVFKVKTPDGILVVQVNEPNAEVFVDGDRMTVSWNDGGTKAEIHVKPGTRKVEVKKDGFGVDGKELTFKDGNREVFSARLLPEPRVANADAPLPSDTKKPDAPPIAGTADDGKGFTPLFNGKDLTGWSLAPIETGNYQGWAVEEGALVAHGADSKTRNFLFCDREYADFVLRLEFSFDQGAHLSAGVGLRAIPGEKLPAYGGLHQDYPVLKLQNATGGEETGTTNWVLDGFESKPDQSADLEPQGSWNRLEIEVKGRTIRTWVNGSKILDRVLPEGALLSDGSVPALGRPKGRIGLQKHTGTVRYRKIEIKELTSAKLSPPPEQPVPAPPADPFQPMSVWVDGRSMTLTVMERKGEMFRARFVIGNGIDREVTGTVKDGKLSWLAKDVRAIKGRAGDDNQATITSDKDGELLDFTYSDKGHTIGAFVLRLKTGR